MKIIDNFLADEDFEWIFDEVNSPDTCWHYSEIISSATIAGYLREEMRLIIDPIHNSQFCFKLEPDVEYIKPLVAALGAKEIKRIKVNMTLPTKEHVNHGFHVDYADDWRGTNPDPCKTAIYYINSNNGYTEFEDGSKVESRANRVCVFDNGLKHAGVTTTTSTNRIVVNINYYE